MCSACEPLPQHGSKTTLIGYRPNLDVLEGQNLLPQGVHLRLREPSASDGAILLLLWLQA